MDINKCKIRNNIKNIEIVRFDIKINNCNHKLFKTLFGVEKLPLSLGYVEIEIKNVSLCVVNTIRRLLFEISGKCLDATLSNVELNTDPYVQSIQLCETIRNIPLKLQIDSDIIKATEFYIDEENDSPVDKIIYSNSLKCKNSIKPIFNPSFPLVILGARKSIKLNKIKIIRGNIESQFRSVFQIGIKTLDEEKYSNTEIIEGDARNKSGYKKSSLIMDPLHHLLTFNLSAVTNEDEIKILLKDVFILIIGKLQKILSNNEINIIELNDKQKLLSIVIEKDITLIELIKKTLFDITNNEITNFEYVEIADGYKLNVTHATPNEVLIKSISKAIEIFKTINDELIKI